MAENSNNNNTNPPANPSLDVSFANEVPEVSFKQAGESLVMVSLRAPVYQPEKRAAIDIVAVIDKSGSMEGEKLNLVKTMLNHMVDTMEPSDQLSIVTYQDGVTTDLPPTLQTLAGKETAKDAIAPITSGGCTNLGGGLAQGAKELAKRTQKNDVASILLFTDGLVNVGPNSAPQIIRAAKEASTAKPVDDNNNSTDTQLPGTINTFGFGGDHDATLLRALAESGSGVYYYIENASKITESFADCFGGLLSTLGQNIQVSFEAGTGVHIKKILTKYSTRTVVPNAHYVVSLGDMQSEENRDIITLVDLPSLEQPHDSFPIMKVTLSYQNAVTGKEDTKSVIAAVVRPENVPPGLKRDFNLDKQNNRIIASDALEQAAFAGTASDFSKATAVLSAAISRIQESVSAADDFCKNLVADLEKCKEGLKNKAQYTTSGHQTLTHNYMAHSYQRSTNQAWSSQTAYNTSSRAAVSKKWTS